MIGFNIKIKWCITVLLVILSLTKVCAGNQLKSKNTIDTAFVSSYGLSYPEDISTANKIYIENYINRYEKRFVVLKKKNGTLLKFFSHALETYSIPKELGVLAIIESELENKSISKAGAVGPWQFMQHEANSFGLKNKNRVDERMDFYKSTYAACKLLKELHNTFGDWLLVVAAYNCGPNRVKKAMIQMNSSSYWKIESLLPKETQNHVKKFISVSYIVNNKMPNDWFLGGKTALKANEPLLCNYLTCSISTGYSLIVIARKLELTYKEIIDLNPDFEIKRSTQSSYLLKVPRDKMPDFYLYKDEILKESIEEIFNKTKN